MSILPPVLRRRSWIRTAVVVVGLLAVLVGVPALLARFVRTSWQPAIIAAAFVPYAIPCVLAGVVLLAASRLWPATAAGVVVLIAVIVPQLPLLVGSSAPGPGVRLVVLQANVRLGHADAGSIVRRVAAEHADVLTVDELTPGEVDRLEAAGVSQQLPFHFTSAGFGGSGTGIWSRYPLSSPQRLPGFSFAVLSAEVAVPGAQPVSVYAVHLSPPWPFPARIWVAEIARLRTVLNQAAGTGRSLIVSGDFNATLDHPQLRRVLGTEFRDANQQTGTGYLATYPTDRWFPPLITIDHVLLHQAGATSVKTVSLPGSDHRGLVVDVVLPRTA